jgi:glutaconate CoA-transferase subunit B
VITDLCVMEPEPSSRELSVSSLHPGVSRERVEAATGWRIRFAEDVAETLAPDARELEVLRRVRAETEHAHSAKENPCPSR